MNEPIFDHERLVCDVLNEGENRTGKSQVRRIVAMLTKLVARNELVSEARAIYRTAFEHEHEHEHEVEPEPSDATEFSVLSRLLIT